MKPQEQLIKMVGKDDANRYIEMVKGMLQAKNEEELKVANK